MVGLECCHAVRTTVGNRQWRLGARLRRRWQQRRRRRLRRSVSSGGQLSAAGSSSPLVLIDMARGPAGARYWSFPDTLHSNVLRHDTCGWRAPPLQASALLHMLGDHSIPLEGPISVAETNFMHSPAWRTAESSLDTNELPAPASGIATDPQQTREQPAPPSTHTACTLPPASCSID